MRKVFPLAVIVIMTAVALLPWASSPAEAAGIVVSPANMNGWASGIETGSAGTVEFVDGPGTPPAGTGSVRFTLGDATTGVVIGTQNYADIRFDSFTALTFSTYQVTPGPASAAFQFNVDYDLTDGTTSWQGRLVYEPYNNGTAQANTWQNWNALAGNWWMTGTPVVGGALAVQICPQSTPCSVATLLGAYPNMGIQAGVLAGILFKAGSGWSSFDGYVDNLHFAAAGVDDTIDFELSTTPIVDGGGNLVPVPGCDVLIEMPEQAVVGTFVDYALVHWMPGEATHPPITVDAGKSYFVAGMDETEQYYKVLISCDWVWVEVGTLGPNYDAVWNGTPLPTEIVE